MLTSTLRKLWFKSIASKNSNRTSDYSFISRKEWITTKVSTVFGKHYHLPLFW